MDKWDILKEWLQNDKRNGMGHKVNRALFLMEELEEKESAARSTNSASTPLCTRCGRPIGDKCFSCLR